MMEIKHGIDWYRYQTEQANARASQIDEDAVMEAIAAGASLRDLMAQFRIGHARAKQLQTAWQEQYA